MSINLVNEFYQILFRAKSPLLKAARIYATSPGFSMYYYENTRFLSIPFIARIENTLPYVFGQETGQLSYFSLRVEAFLVYQTSNQTSEDVTYTITLAD